MVLRKITKRIVCPDYLIVAVGYSQTSVIMQFYSRPSRFSTKKFEIFMSQTSNINSGRDQTAKSQANTNAL